MNKNKKGQAGFIVTVELLLITVVLIVGLLAGWTKLRDQVTSELSDAGDAIGSIDQSYKIRGVQWNALPAAGIAAVASFGFDDLPDNATATQVGGDGMFVVYSTAAVSSTQNTPTEIHSTLF